MSNKVYTVKIAESHLTTIISALSELPFKTSQSIITSLVAQARNQPKPEAANDEAHPAQIEAAE
jgi:hypothetical protein